MPANLSQQLLNGYHDAGVPEPGLNSGSTPLGKGGGLKWLKMNSQEILWRRPPWVRIPPPAPPSGSSWVLRRGRFKVLGDVVPRPGAAILNVIIDET